MIGFNYRFNALYEGIRKSLKTAKLGELVGVRSVFSAMSRDLPGWKKSLRMGGGVLADLAMHHADLVHFFFEEEVQSVYAERKSQRSEGDSAVMELKLASGLLVQSFFSMNAVDEDRFEIYGQAGKLAVDRYLSWSVEWSEPAQTLARFKRLWGKFRSLIHSPYLVSKILSPSCEPSYRTALGHFVECVRQNHPAKPDFDDGFKSLSVIEAAAESARTGKVVSINPEPMISHMSSGIVGK